MQFCTSHKTKEGGKCKGAQYADQQGTTSASDHTLYCELPHRRFNIVRDRRKNKRKYVSIKRLIIFLTCSVEHPGHDLPVSGGDSREGTQRLRRRHDVGGGRGSRSRGGSRRIGRRRRGGATPGGGGAGTPSASSSPSSSPAGTAPI